MVLCWGGLVGVWLWVLFGSGVMCGYRVWGDTLSIVAVGARFVLAASGAGCRVGGVG